MRRRRLNRRLLVALATSAVLAVGPFACSSSTALSPAGGACSVVTDCQNGLVCCNATANKNAATTCNASVLCLQPGGAGADSDSGAAGMSPGDDANPNQSDGKSPETDGAVTEPPDTGAPAGQREAGLPPVDAGKPADTGAHEASTPPDSGGGTTDAAGD